MIKIFVSIYVCLCFFANAAVGIDPGEDLYPNIHKIDNGLYFSKIQGKSLYLAMERITGENRAAWLQYARDQKEPSAVAFAQNVLGSLQKFSGDGSGHFASVLKEVSIVDNEIWVAYVTANAKHQHIKGEKSEHDKLQAFVYALKDDPNKERKIQERLNLQFIESIKMFVTVTSSPMGLITSHMGISASIEGIITGGHKGLSMYLHSFAAQIMKRRNPERRYMMNAPVWEMAKIMEEKLLPKESVFLGTREQERAWKQIYKETVPLSLEEFIDAQEPAVRTQVLEQAKNLAVALMQEKIDDINKEIKERSESEEEKPLTQCQDDFVKNTLVRRFKISGVWLDNPLYQVKVERSPSGGDLVFRKDYYESSLKALESSKKKEILKELFHKDHPHLSTTLQRQWLSLMPGHSSILSLDAEEGAAGNSSFTIYESSTSQNPWLHVKEGNPNYNWIFTDPFRPAPSTQYVVVDLEALARFAAGAP